MDQTGGEAAHGSQITNFRLGRGAAKRDGRWVGGMAPSSYPYSIGGIGVDRVS